MKTAAADPPDLGEASAALSAWFLAHRRELPWRRELSGNRVEEGPADYPRARRDPYRSWISEIMLQQTQVATVVEYFNRWMLRFPDLASLARAREAEVLSAWAGLGYYSRARNLLAAARAVQESHGGRFPWRREDLLALPGIGEYTAGAIASLAFNLPEPILDGNLVRVFSRVYALPFLPDSAERKRTYWELARAWVSGPAPALVNEGLMELGALVCSPRQPRCEACPLAGFCRARAGSRQADFPPPKPRKPARLVRGYAVMALSGRKVLVYRPAKGELLAGLATFPVFPAGSLPALRKAWRDTLPGLPLPEFLPRAHTVSHGITHHQFRLRLVEARLGARTSGSLPAGYRWVQEGRVDDLFVSSLPRKLWQGFRAARPAAA